ADDRHLGREEPAQLAVRIVEVAADDRVLGADDLACRLETHLGAVRAVVALLRRAGRLVDVERIVGAGLRARLAADARRAVEVDDAVGAALERADRADRDAWRALALVAAQHRERAAHVRMRAVLEVLDPGTERPERDLVLGLARDGARVAADAAAVVD